MRSIERSGLSIRGRTALGAALFLIAGAGCDAAFAAKVYRCGNAFQDTPCEAAKPAEIRPADKAAVPRDATPAAATTASVRVTPTPRAAAPDRIVLDPPAPVVVVRR